MRDCPPACAIVIVYDEHGAHGREPILLLCDCTAFTLLLGLGATGRQCSKHAKHLVPLKKQFI